MKRRMIAAVAACILLSMTACSAAEPDGDTTGATLAGQTTPGTTTATTVGGDTVPTGSAVTTTAAATTKKPTTTTTQLVLSGDELFAETTVVDNANCLIKITKVEEAATAGYTLHAHLENRTAGTQYLFAVDKAAVNGVVVESVFATELSAGESAEEAIVFTDVVPAGVNIGTYTDITLQFTVSDVENWDAPPAAQVTTHIYPKGQDKAAVHTHKPQKGETVLLDTANVTVIARSSAENTIRGYYYTDIYIKNKTADELVFSVDNVTLNGVGISPNYGVKLEGGYATYDRIVWMYNTLAAANVSRVEQIAFDFYAYSEQDLDSGMIEDENWQPPYAVDETITYTP